MERENAFSSRLLTWPVVRIQNTCCILLSKNYRLAICAKYDITPEQFDRCTHITLNGRKGFYIVESQSEACKEYRVEWNEQYQCLQCLPHNGEACEASTNGIPCWHKRAALAAEEHYKASRLNEQAEIEATPEYQFEQAMRDLEDALDELDALAARQERRTYALLAEAEKIKNDPRYALPLNGNDGFHLLK